MSSTRCHSLGVSTSGDSRCHCKTCTILKNTVEIIENISGCQGDVLSPSLHHKLNDLKTLTEELKSLGDTDTAKIMATVDEKSDILASIAMGNVVKIADLLTAATVNLNNDSLLSSSYFESYTQTASYESLAPNLRSMVSEMKTWNLSEVKDPIVSSIVSAGADSSANFATLRPLIEQINLNTSQNAIVAAVDVVGSDVELNLKRHMENLMDLYVNSVSYDTFVDGFTSSDALTLTLTSDSSSYQLTPLKLRGYLHSVSAGSHYEFMNSGSKLVWMSSASTGGDRYYLSYVDNSSDTSRSDGWYFFKSTSNIDPYDVSTGSLRTDLTFPIGTSVSSFVSDHNSLLLYSVSNRNLPPSSVTSNDFSLARA